MSIYQLKPAFQNLLRPLVNRLAQHHITPNQVTLATVALSLLTGLLLALLPTNCGILFFIPIFMLIRMMLNAIDGMLAREHQMQTALGTFYNELGDVFSDAFLYLPFCLIPDLSPILIIAIVLLAIISEMTGVIAVLVGAQRRYDGPMGKSDRAFGFAVISILLGFRIIPPSWLNFLLIIVVLLSALTIINRTRHALKEIA